MDREDLRTAGGSAARVAVMAVIVLAPTVATLTAWAVSTSMGPPGGLIEWKRGAFWSGFGVAYLFRAVSHPAYLLPLLGALGVTGLLTGRYALRSSPAAAFGGAVLLMAGAAAATVHGFHAGRLHPLDLFALPGLFGLFCLIGAALPAGLVLARLTAMESELRRRVSPSDGYDDSGGRASASAYTSR